MEAGLYDFDEKSLSDADVRWPEGKRCAIHIVVDLSVASGPEGIGPRDLASPAALFAPMTALDLLLGVLARHALRATFAVPAVMAECYPDRVKARSSGSATRWQRTASNMRM